MRHPKETPERSQRYRELARDKPCLLQVPDICRGDPRTTVLAHSNQSIHGKGMAQKAHDHMGVWACYHCHVWLDTGKADKEEKLEVFEEGLRRQAGFLQRMVGSLTTRASEKEAAQWALDRLREAGY